jgi:hypothetical protein
VGTNPIEEPLKKRVIPFASQYTNLSSVTHIFPGVLAPNTDVTVPIAVYATLCDVYTRVFSAILSDPVDIIFLYS